ncbi:hypothetical protein DM02DRAFT_535258 [Periconia macrospinosa]|uniref:DUF7888 domain-containing protein n=1 Tax=Periconia macrospinosa TaxID=97972 RepID=A0A2V1DEI5_9PLEO|nr:hypothetical protein DM02DRAFT_535258 [Periconia macrospinosa]
MHFSKVAISLVAAAALSTATPLPQSADVPPNANVPATTESSFTGRKGTDGVLITEPAPNQQTDQALQRRQSATGASVSITSGNAIAKIAKIAIEIATDTLKNLGEWNETREKFTKETVAALWDRNPDYTKYAAAVCYNKGYRLANPAGITELASAKLELGLLNTDYDCMLIETPNQFFTDSAGGYINLAYRYDSRCSFDQSTGDLTCK